MADTSIPDRTKYSADNYVVFTLLICHLLLAPCQDNELGRLDNTCLFITSMFYYKKSLLIPSVLVNN